MICSIDVVKKSLSILPACLLFVACGKKPVSSSNSDEIVITPELNKNVAMEIKFSGDTELTSKSYMFERDAQVTIPELIHLKSGTPLNYMVNIYFNTNHSPEQRDTESEFYCSYENLKLIGDAAKDSPTGYLHRFAGCFEDVDRDGEVENLEYKAGQQIFQEKWRYVRVDLVSGFSYEDSEIFTELRIKWF